MNAFCLVTFRPNKIWCDFLSSFINYKIFIIIDDDNFDVSQFIIKYTNINFIKIENTKCQTTGYINSSLTLKKLISGWDKALYYFGVEEINYDFIWFMEDDVFFYSEDTILNIDKKYVNEDLLSNIYGENKNGAKNKWHWSKINIQYPPPYYCGMMCATRFSRNMMSCINKYTTSHKTLFFIEAMFPTVAIKNNLKYSTPNELTNITYNKIPSKSIININNFYHPVKDLNDHVYFREDLNDHVYFRENNHSSRRYPKPIATQTLLSSKKMPSRSQPLNSNPRRMNK